MNTQTTTEPSVATLLGGQGLRELYRHTDSAKSQAEAINLRGRFVQAAYTEGNTNSSLPNTTMGTHHSSVLILNGMDPDMNGSRTWAHVGNSVREVFRALRLVLRGK